MVTMMMNETPAEIYDYPIPYMTPKGIFMYLGIDIIPLRHGD